MSVLLDTVELPTAGLPSGPSWLRRAACAGLTPDLFYPDERGPDPDGRRSPAKAICRRCPVRRDCLSDALNRDDEYGIWGGLTPRERRNLKKSKEIV
ncbi:WhiB family transcriptional regulator [Actinopolymorpha alba]|uniref:WhiB family transcriptional regulator n=1 Tax=Actinopolymorpha alba TaxID=533267 RepID=UPI00036AF2DC|nr:WhiB family transcriptional regulator [Actinopolymorpha alba]